MKCVEMFRDFQYRPRVGWSVMFQGGTTFRNVIEAAANAIVAAGAGRLLPDAVNEHDRLADVDAWQCWQQHGRKRHHG